MEILGYTFKDARLGALALTTASYRMDDPGAADNQRLEFLGDAVLEMLATEQLYHDFPDEQEGALTARRKHMVSTAALCAVAAQRDLAGRLKRGKGAAEMPNSSKTIADAVEAVIGAVWLDGGWEAARGVYASLALAAHATSSEWQENPKGELQVRAQALVPPRQPTYILLGTKGTSNEPVFTVKVVVEGLGEAIAEGRSKKDAQMGAAQKLLNMI